MLEKLAFAALEEQKAQRRWKLYTRLAWFALILFTVWAVALRTPSADRDRLTAGIYMPKNPNDALPRLEAAMTALVAASGVLGRIKEAMKQKLLPKGRPEDALAASGAAPGEPIVTTSPESWSERLSALDAGFLDLEAPNAPMHVGSVSIFSGKVPSQREMADLIASRLDRVPRYAQKLASVPFGLGRPVWVDDPDFDLDRHVLATSLPRPGLPELRRFVADLFARPLDRDRPLWEYWLLGGLGRGRFAVVTKTHHCMIDGSSGVDLANIQFSTSPIPPELDRPERFRPRPSPRRFPVWIRSWRP